MSKTLSAATKSLSIRDALLELRRFVADDESRGSRVRTLAQQLSEAISERDEAARRALSSLEGAVFGMSSVIGFNPDLDGLLVASQTKITKKQKTIRPLPIEKTEPVQVAVVLESDLSEVESRVSDLLKTRWPKFTSPSMMVREGSIDNVSHASPTITRLRRKNLPIESAKQARENDPTIAASTTGWRLIRDQA